MSKYQTGKSGNPKGRPAGLPDRRRKFRELIQDAVPELIAKALELARAGDTAALRLLLDRAVPPIRAEAQVLNFPYSIGSTLSESGRAVLAAVAEGSMSPDSAKSLLEALGVQSRLIESDELVKRIEALEQLKENRSGK
jgi:hypothetical protein